MADVLVFFPGENGAVSGGGGGDMFPNAEHRPFASIRKVFESVEVGRADYGLVPMDNSQAGSINETYDLFLKHGLHLVGETVVRIDHCLLALAGTAIDDLGEANSRRQARADRCDSVTSRRGALRTGDPRLAHPDLSRQLHALRRTVSE